MTVTIDRAAARLRRRLEFLSDCAKAFVGRNAHFGGISIQSGEVPSTNNALRALKAEALVADWEALFDEIEKRRPEPPKP